MVSNIKQERGFTALEALISVTVFSVLMLIGITAFQGSDRLSKSTLVQGDSQQSARLAIDHITHDLRAVGYDIDVVGGQRALVHAGPWDVIFNANIGPGDDAGTAIPGFPRAINLALPSASVPPRGALYQPAVTFDSGAETYRYTIDSSGDGVVSADDVADDPEEATSNPRDYVLRKEIYGEFADGTNGGISVAAGLIRGPDADPDGVLPTPLFTYWLDHDDDALTPPVLHGDLDGDGELNQAEIAWLDDVADADMALVTRVVVTVTVEDGESQGRGVYRARQLTSSISFRNQIRRTGLIAGSVFLDEDSDGRFDVDSESPIPDVLVRLDTGSQVETDDLGRYFFEVTPGTYTVMELDPAGHESTTPNSVTLVAATGSTFQVDFGDRPVSGVGTIGGTVFSDDNMNSTWDGGERGIEGVVITLNTGVADTTDAWGDFDFTVPIGSYTVVETDSIGWTSTTENVVEVILETDGETEKVIFGDVLGGDAGTIRGVVYLDADEDKVLDDDEEGIADVPIYISSGDSTLTNGNGEYSFSVIPGAYYIFETDIDGYSSTTPNFVSDLLVLPDSTVEVNFGDLFDTSLNFTVVSVGETDRALSIGTGDLGEDAKGDPDIVLGTETAGGTSNLHVWHNKRKNATTAITALFASTPSFSRNAGAPIPAELVMDASSDGTPDVVTGLGSTTGTNLLVWETITSTVGKGTLPNSPTSSAATNGGSSVLAFERVGWRGWGKYALVVGARDGEGSGHVEVWLASGSSSFTHHSGSDLYYDAKGALGEVTSIASGDFNGDGTPDLAIGQDLGGYDGKVSIFFGSEGESWSWVDRHVFWPEGAVTSIAAVDMVEDADGDVDLLVGTSRGSASGVIEMWENEGEGIFGLNGESGRVRSDWIDAGGEVLSLRTERLDPDIFPDVIAGLRTSSFAGALHVYRGVGYLPSAGTEWSHSGSGEVVTLTVDDFNLDGLPDVAAGTRTAVSTGELVVYFGQ